MTWCVPNQWAPLGMSVCMFVKKGDFQLLNVYLTSLNWFNIVIQYCAKVSSHLSFLCFAQEMGKQVKQFIDTCANTVHKRKKTVCVILTTLRQVCIWQGFTKQPMNERTDTSVKSFLRSQLEFLFPKDFQIVSIFCLLFLTLSLLFFVIPFAVFII